jgi:SAM-dependent methyltransferase
MSQPPPALDYDRVATAYAQHRRVHPEVLAALCTGAHAISASRVLEIGCGTGNYVRAMRAQLGCRTWGIDPSIEMLGRARAQDSESALQVGRAEALPYANACFDLAYSVDVIHHVVDRAAYVREACRVLDQGGMLCTVTDSAWVIRRRAPLSTYFPETVPLELARYPRIATLQEMMAAAGLREIAARTVTYAYETREIGAYRARAFSALHVISDRSFRRGLSRLERDVARGPIKGVARYTLLWGRKWCGCASPRSAGGVISSKNRPGGGACATK